MSIGVSRGPSGLSSVAFGLALGAALTGCPRWSDHAPLLGDEPSAADTTAPQENAATAPLDCGDRSTVPNDIACTGLYKDLATKTLAPGVRTFRPAEALWSDGAEKTRYIYLPPKTTIDTSNPDEWRFPVGTKTWKEFRVGGKLIETRYFEKVREDRWLRTAYAWSEDGKTARRTDGARRQLGDQVYDIPSPDDCDRCHKGRKDRLLGFEAVSLGLPGAEGVNLETLSNEGLIGLAPAQQRLAFPDGNDTEAKALSWLHINCGVSCHNDNTNALAEATGLRFQLRVAELDGTSHPWDGKSTTLGVAAKTPAWRGRPRIAAGDPKGSLLLELISQRGQEQMPPLGTHYVDTHHVEVVEGWIRSLAAPDIGTRDAKGSDTKEFSSKDERPTAGALP